MMKKLILLLAILSGAGVVQAQTALWGGKTASQGNTFLSPYTGAWNGSAIVGTYGGTGVNNGSNTITLGGNLTTSGAYGVTFTLTNTTSLTLPTSGTLVNDAVGTLSSLASIGTITTGVWSGTAILPAKGGTGLTTITAHGVMIGEGTGNVAPTTAGTAGQMLCSNGASSDPGWSTPTYPMTSATTRKILVSDGTNFVASTETYATPGASGNVMKSDGTNWTSGTVSGGGMTVTAITADQTAAINNKYVNNKASTQLALTLPAVAAVGSQIAVVGGSDAAGWKIVGIAGAIFHSDATTGTTGTGAYVATATQYSSATITCIVANTEWVLETSSGSLTLN